MSYSMRHASMISIIYRHWPLLFLALLVSIGFIRLGVWQLDRAAEKDYWTQRYQAGQKAKPVSISSGSQLALMSQDYQPVIIRGKAIEASQLLLDNQIRNGVRGFDVWLPVALSDGRWVVVSRGWLKAPGNGEAALMPTIPKLITTPVISGLFRALPEAGWRLGEAVMPNEGWPKIVNYPNTDELEVLWQQPVVKGIVLQKDHHEDGLLRDWQVISMSVEKHYAYAVQWFALAITVWIVTGGLLWRTVRGRQN